MKRINKIKSCIGLLLLTVTFASCKKDFLEQPPLSSVVDANFYKTDEQVMAATSLLYSNVWFDYNDQAMYNLGDFRGGTAFSAWNDRGNVMFNTTGDNPQNGASWRAFYNVVAQSNIFLYNLNRYGGDVVTAHVRSMATE